MKKQTFKILGLCALALGMLMPIGAAAQTIKVEKLDTAPILDGNADDWNQVEATIIPLAGQTDLIDVGINAVSVKVGVAGDSVYFLWQWKDDSEDLAHKPFIWDEKAGKYETTNQMEDRFSVNFAMEGDFTYDWFSGQTFKADMWHWKTARSNPLGLAQDKMTIITTDPVKQAFKTIAKNNKEIYIVRPDDEGDKLYKTMRYAVKEEDMMQKYVLNKDPQGSGADVKANGRWKDGVWTLELRRLLDTGHPDDLVFKAGDLVPAAIAVFNHSGDDQHNISETIYFQF